MVRCLTIHTERLHDDRVWCHVRRFADYLFRRGISATWFSINPTASAYRAQGYDESFWRMRLRYLTDHGQDIQQHTHFYRDLKGDHDYSVSAMRARLREDRVWLTSLGCTISGFVSGAWALPPVLLPLLAEEGYAYDCTARAFSVSYLPDTPYALSVPPSLREIPTTSPITRFRIPHGYSMPYFHDYDLLRLPVRALAYGSVAFHRPSSFVSPMACR